jgi:hypothetical protein
MLKAILFCSTVINLVISTFIDNTIPRTDINGNWMDIHDGNVLKLDDNLFYWYGMGYQDCELEKGLIPPRNCPGIYQEFGHCGFRTDHSVNLYTSPDLERWTFVKDIFPDGSRPDGIYFRPKVIYNKATHELVLWINYLAPAKTPLASYPGARLMVAVSDSPEGPYEIVTDFAAIEASGGGDFNLMIDPNDANATAYIAYDAWGNNHALVIEQLTPDYHDSLGALASTGTISPISNEAPILFERQGWYYLLYGHTCCFCEQGSGAEVWAADHPLGPWINLDLDINPGSLLSGREIKAQCNSVIKLEHQNKPDEYLYTGDLWSSAPDKLKSHDIQYWSSPLEFDDSEVPPTIKPMHFVNNFNISIN